MCVEPRLHRPSPIPLRRPDVFHVLAGEGGCTRAIGYVSTFFVRFRNVLIGWAFDVRRVRRFAGLLCFILAPTRLAVSMSAELAAYHVSHIARSKLVYGASPTPSLAALKRGRYERVAGRKVCKCCTLNASRQRRSFSLSAKPAGCDMRRSAEGAANHRARASSLRSSARQLTPLEREVHEAFAAAGVPIVVVMNVEELAHRRVGHGRARSIRSRRIAHCR